LEPLCVVRSAERASTEKRSSELKTGASEPKPSRVDMHQRAPTRLPAHVISEKWGCFERALNPRTGPHVGMDESRELAS
jgi:hypothetical protein